MTTPIHARRRKAYERAAELAMLAERKQAEHAAELRKLEVSTLRPHCPLGALSVEVGHPDQARFFTPSRADNRSLNPYRDAPLRA
jgi:hypothetical protein